MKQLPRSFYEGSATKVAPKLLNKILDFDGIGGRIVEVEAYEGEADPASHAFRGMTARNAVMFGEPGHLYVYFTYGMHFCCNVVCGEAGRASAVLIRALDPVSGIEMMQARRGKATGPNLTNGPAKLCQALAINRDQDGTDLVASDSKLAVYEDRVSPPSRPGIGPRVGIRSAKEFLWRWWVPENPFVSKGRP